MTGLDELLDAALERKTLDPNTAIAVVTLQGEPIKLRFTELGGRDWAACTLASIPRSGVATDSVFGFNVTMAAELAAPKSGVRVVEDSETELTAEQWSRLFDAVDSTGRQAITDAVMAVNEHAQIARIHDAKKALEGLSKRKRPSQEK